MLSLLPFHLFWPIFVAFFSHQVSNLSEKKIVSQFKFFFCFSDEYEDDLSYGPKKPKKPENIIACPVCRTDLVKDEWDPQQLLHENEGILQPRDGDKLVRTKSLEDLQRKMKDLWECQKAKREKATVGIIQNR